MTYRDVATYTADKSGNASATAQKVLEQNYRRKYVAIQNLAATNISIGLGYAPASTAAGIVLAEMGSYEINLLNPFFGDIYILGTAAAEAFACIEVSS